MANKLPNIDDNGLGNLDSILSNQGVSDLSWLAVDEAEYHAAEALPRQNLDIIPELQKALVMGDDRVPQLIPLKPHVMVNRNPSDVPQTSRMDMTIPIRNRVAHLVMTGLPMERLNVEIERRLSAEFSPRDIEIARPAIDEVKSEHGLLGSVYIDASHFPHATNDPKERRLANVLSKNATFVISGCQGKGGCPCHQTGFCLTFGGKRVVDEVPYSRELALHYAPKLESEKRPVDLTHIASGTDTSYVTADEWKERIRSAFNRSAIAMRDGEVRRVQTQYKPVAPTITKSDVESFLDRRTSASGIDALPSATYQKFARRMMDGQDDVLGLKSTTNPELHALAGEFGILGHTYIDVDSAGGCRQALALVESKDLQPDFILRRSASCGMCMDAKDGACAQLCQSAKLVHSRPVIDRMAFGKALLRSASQNRLPMEQARQAAQRAPEKANWKSLVRQANLYQPKVVQEVTEYTAYRSTAHYGQSGQTDVNVASQIDEEDVRRSVSHMMNMGLTGKKLQETILKQYAREDLVQVPEVGRQASLNDGVQGHYFVDPTAYKDYGKGCDEGSKYFRKRGAPHVLASSNCTGCNLQTAPGWCSKYAKTMIRQVPTELHDNIVAARRQLPVVQNIPAENPVEKFELASEMVFDVEKPKSRLIEVEIPGGSLDD